MNAEIEIKEEDPSSNGVFYKDEGKLCAIKTNSEAVLLDNECDRAIKTEVKSETSFLDCCSQKVRMQIRSETVTSSNFQLYIKSEVAEQTQLSDLSTQNNMEFLPQDSETKVKKYNCDNEVDNKIVIKVEPWWLETEATHGCDDIMDGDFPAVKSSRLCTEAVSGHSSSKSPLVSAETSIRDGSFYNGEGTIECEIKEDVAQKLFHSKQSVNFSDGAEMYSRTLHVKQKNFMRKGERPHKCAICDKNFAWFSHLKKHNLIHEGKKPHQCKTCDKSFALLSNLKRHNLLHEDKKPHQCKICNKSYTLSSTLKKHNLFHDSKKPYQCKTCNKSFTQLSDLKRHNLIHEDKKPHQCKTCNKRFTQFSDLKIHNLIHEGKKPHQCLICGKSFTQLSSLKSHILIHEGKKPHHCKTCDKSFTDLSNLKRHQLIHEAKKLHHCETCDKYFNRLSGLKRHRLIHQ